MPNECQNCEFGHYTIGDFNKPVSADIFKHLWSICLIYIECLHWDRPDDPFFIRASDPTPKDCPKKADEKFCKICGQGPDVDHNGCIIIGMHR